MYESNISRKENIIKLCLVLYLNKDEGNELLDSAGYVLSTNINFNLVILFCLENGIHDISIINDYLLTLF